MDFSGFRIRETGYQILNPESWILGGALLELMQTAELNIFISQVERIIYEMRSSAGRILLLLQFRSVSFRLVIVLFCFTFSVKCLQIYSRATSQISKINKSQLMLFN